MKKFFVYFISAVVLISLFVFLAVSKDKNAKNNDSGENATSVPVLIYHHFLTDEDKAKYEPTKDYSVSLSVFEEQLKYLKDNGYKSLTPSEMLCWKKNECKIPLKSFMITIDDGQKSVMKYAYPLLKKYGFTALSFVISSRIGDYGEWDPSTYQYLSGDDLKDNGVIYFGSHSDDMHRYVDDKKRLYTMSYKEIYDDVKLSMGKINTKYFAYPFNTYNKDFTKALENAGYQLAFRGQSRKTIQSENRYMISRIFVSDNMESFKAIFETDKYDYKVEKK